ncbi:hypothetical protein ES705_17432 [subsurface metagenome]|nr:hypothetical protein [Methanosarcinales archaeon]
MKKYIVRGCEDAVTKALNEHGLACILGIPGVGKTATARYIALKRRKQGFIPIILTSADTDITLKDRLIEFADERGDKHTVLQIPIAAYNKIDNDLAKSIAEAIAKVVNATLEDKILENVSRITEKSDLVKKFADVIKGVGKKLDIPREIVENAKSTLKEVSNFVDIEEFVKYGADFCSCFLLGVDVVKLAEKLKGKGGVLKLKKKIVVIIDDLADFKFGDGAALLRLEDWLIKNGAKVLLIRRINLEEEFMGISKETNDSYVRYTNKILAGSRDARVFEGKRQVVFMATPDFDTFKEIIEANVEERLKPEDIGSLFQVSGGLPTLAILMQDIGVKYGEETEIDIYSSLEEAKTDVEKARATLNVIRNGIRSVYEEAKRANLALLALFVQPTACEELETLCKSSEIEKVFGRLNCSQNLDSNKQIVKIRKEAWVDGKRKYYELNDNWMHMRLFLDVLCDKEEGVRREVETVRSTLLDIMSEASEKAAWTGRMLLCALNNIERLKDQADDNTMRQALYWGEYALVHYPKWGFEFVPTVLELAVKIESDELLASSYASVMVERCRLMNYPLEEVNEIVVSAEDLMRNRSENPAALAYRAIIYSSIAKMLMQYGEKERAILYMEKSERVLSSISDIKVRDIAKIFVWRDKSEFYSYGSLNDAWHWTENVISQIEKIREKRNDYTSNTFVCGYFKLFGENIDNKKFEEQLVVEYRYAKLLIGDIFRGFGWLEDAEEALKDALEHSKYIGDELESQIKIEKIKVIRDFEFEAFEDLYKQMKEHEIELPPEHIAAFYAEYMLSCMLLGRELEEEEMREAMEHVKTNLIAHALLLGAAHKIFGRFDREEVLNALEMLKTELRDFSTAKFASVLKKLIENERERAFEVAKVAVSGTAQGPLFRRLFAELADGIQRGDDEVTNKALVKLFYLHV